MKKTALILSFIVCLSGLHSQTFDWVRQFANNNYGTAYSIATDAQGNVYTLGSLQGFNLDFDPGPGTSYLNSFGAQDIYLTKQNSNGDLIWVEQFGGNNWDEGYYVTLDNTGNIYITGWFSTTADFDPGPGTYYLNSAGMLDAFVCKLYPNGALAWARGFGGTSTDWGNGLAVDDSGNVYAVGSYRDATLDFDPGPGVYNLTSSGGDDAYICKLDANGDFVWAEKVGGTDHEWANRIQLDASGNLYYVGTTYSPTLDLDPGTGVYNVSIVGQSDMFLCKLNNNGGFIWARQLAGPQYETVQNLVLDTAANIYTTGRFQSNCDFDPDTSQLVLTSHGSYDVFVACHDSSGRLLWANGIGGTGADVGYYIQLDSAERIYISGTFSNTADFDPGSGVFNMASVTASDKGFLLKLDHGGNFIAAKKFGGVSRTAVALDMDENVYLTGNFNLVADFNPDTMINYNLTPNGTYPVFVLKLSPDSCAGFTVMFDSIAAATCSGNGYVSVMGSGGVAPYTYMWNTLPVVNDSILQPAVTGIYEISVGDARGCQRQGSVYIPGPVPGSFDLQANLVAGSFRPGFGAFLSLNALNKSCNPIGGQLRLVMNNLVTFLNATPAPDAINGDTLIWNFSNLAVDSVHVMSNVFVQISPAAQIGQAICLQTLISPTTGDAYPADNNRQYCIPVINGYDPNAKSVYPAGACTNGYIQPNQRLTYAVRFQNTGNADAVNIHVIDSIDAGLDLNTLRVVGSSHPLTTEILPGHAIMFRFDAINLADSTSNEPASHGYVIFEIEQGNSLPTGTALSNRADIYFDYNPAVLTNTVLNTIAYPTYGTAGSISTTACGSYTVNGNTYASSGNYVQHIPDMFGCDSTINLQLVIDHADVSVTNSSPSLVANAVGALYQWLDCSAGYSNLTGETGQVYTASSNGSYAVIVTQNSCSDTSACFSVNNVGLTNAIYGEEKIVVFPNPSNGQVTIAPLNAGSFVIVYDVTGKQLIRKTAAGNSLLIDGLAPGIYSVQIQSEDKSLTLRLVVMQ